MEGEEEDEGEVEGGEKVEPPEGEGEQRVEGKKKEAEREEGKKMVEEKKGRRTGTRERERTWEGKRWGPTVASIQ